MIHTIRYEFDGMAIEISGPDPVRIARIIGMEDPPPGSARTPKRAALLELADAADEAKSTGYLDPVKCKRIADALRSAVLTGDEPEMIDVATDADIHSERLRGNGARLEIEVYPDGTWIIIGGDQAPTAHPDDAARYRALDWIEIGRKSDPQPFNALDNRMDEIERQIEDLRSVDPPPVDLAARLEKHRSILAEHDFKLEGIRKAVRIIQEMQLERSARRVADLRQMADAIESALPSAPGYPDAALAMSGIAAALRQMADRWESEA